ncbi:MAG: DUF1835 domain-containing protein [Acidobacteriota bacterium]|nr:DUF1835 domain-containing protein [Acidobacteriota bacterium]
MKIHVLPGDSSVETFEKTNIEGEIVVCRECLIDGDFAAGSLDDFWRERENYLSAAYPKINNFYLENVKTEFEKLLKVSAGDEINLWFEYELFCQTNMWFCLWLLKDKNAEVFRVAPVVRSENDLWKGFGGLRENDLEKCFAQKIKFGKEDILLGVNLWEAFQNRDFQILRDLSGTKSNCFAHLNEICQAAIELQSRPKERLKEIVSEGETDFQKVFERFSKTEGIYGFGDLQVKRIYDEITR